MSHSIEAHSASIRDFTNEEKEMMAVFLRRKQEYEQQLVYIQDKIVEMTIGYHTIYNGRSPLLSLPNEVTSLIFDFAQLPTDLEEAGQNADKVQLHEKDKYLMEVVVSHVCRRWRSISLGYSSLWTKFYYIASHSKGQHVPLDRFEAYLGRSGTLPLYLWFDFRKVEYDLRHPLLLDWAVDEVERWKQFTVYAGGGNWVLQGCYQLHNVHAPLLEAFVLILGDDPTQTLRSESIDNLNPAIFAKGSPNLKFCMLDEHPFVKLRPPLWNITSLRLYGDPDDLGSWMAPQVVVDLLSIPSLQHLSLHGPFVEPQTVIPQIIMPHLECLQVSQFDYEWCYLTKIRAPRLETLLIHDSYFYPETSSACPLDQYNFPVLRKLWIVNSRMGEEMTSNFFTMTREATNVFVLSPHLDHFFDVVSSYPDKETLWPHLKVMTVGIRGLKSMEPCVAFASSRANPFTLRLHHSLLSCLEADLVTTNERSRLEEFCTLEVIYKKDWLMDVESFWPKHMKIPRGFAKNYSADLDVYETMDL